MSVKERHSGGRAWGEQAGAGGGGWNAIDDVTPAERVFEGRLSIIQTCGVVGAVQARRAPRCSSASWTCASLEVLHGLVSVVQPSTRSVPSVSTAGRTRSVLHSWYLSRFSSRASRKKRAAPNCCCRRHKRSGGPTVLDSNRLGLPTAIRPSQKTAVATWTLPGRHRADSAAQARGRAPHSQPGRGTPEA